MYEIRYARTALRTLRRIPSNWAETIMDKVQRLAHDPYAPNNNVTKLRGREGYRLRVGDWRVIYELDDGVLVLLVVGVGPRGGVYEQ